MICTHCGHVGEMSLIDSSYPMDGGAAMVPETYLVCPVCGMDDVEPCRPCGVCGEMVSESTHDERGLWMCDSCWQETYDQVQAFRESLPPAKINAVARMLEDADSGAWREADAEC